MKIEQLNSATDGHRTAPHTETFQSEGAMSAYYDALAAKNLYNSAASYSKPYEESSAAFISGTLSSDIPSGSKMTAARPGLSGDGGGSTAGMTFEYFKGKCNACSGIPCLPPPRPKPEMRADDLGHRLPDSTSTGVRRI